MHNWVEVNIPFGRVFDKNNVDIELDSLTKRGLAKPGILIETEDGSRYLIGDINSEGGACDCCSIIYPNEIIVKYNQLVINYLDLVNQNEH